MHQNRGFIRAIFAFSVLLTLTFASPTSFAEAEQLRRIEGLMLKLHPDILPEERRQLLVALLQAAELLEVDHISEIKNLQAICLLAGFIRVESAFHRYAVSYADARGYMQVKPDTANWMQTLGMTEHNGHALFQTNQNLELGVNYINYLSKDFHSLRDVALAYNAGPGSFRQGIFVESYWQNILSTYNELSGTPETHPLVANL